MAKILCKTRGNGSPQRKPRVYFTCHPEDFDACFEKLCEDIFKSHDCAVYYTEDMTAEIPQQDLQTDLGSNNLFVIPVTFKLLTTPNRAMDADFPYAVRSGIPVLPIMMESGITHFYSQPDKFGKLQYLNPYSADVTEISYTDKLKNYLESVLIDDTLTKRIRAAFDAYIFLSYRKKDRHHANRLMRLIHENPECRDIAIWFDEFLTPGESFQESIEKILDDCRLFALLVTPRLFEKVMDENGEEQENYILSTELPMALAKKKEKGTDIFPVEMEQTDRAALAALHIGDCVNTEDEAVFRSRLLEAISGIAVSVNDHDPEHLFLVGLAYMEGIDVEVDRQRGLALITAAGEQGLPEAMEKLYDIYEKGAGAPQDYETAIHWAERLILAKTESAGKEDAQVLWFQTRLAVTYVEMGAPEKANRLNREVYDLRKQLLGEEDPLTLASLINLAYTFRRMGKYEEAMQYTLQACQLTLKIHGECHPDTLIAHGNLAVLYSSLGYYTEALKIEQKVYAKSCDLLGAVHPDTLASLNSLSWDHYHAGQYAQALEAAEKLYAIRCKLDGETHLSTVGILSTLSVFHGKLNNKGKALALAKEAYHTYSRKLGDGHPTTLTAISNLSIAYGNTGNFGRALRLIREVYDGQCRLLGAEHPDTIATLLDMAMTYHNNQDYASALETAQKAYALGERVLGPSHPDTLRAMNTLASAWNHLRKPKEALEWAQKAYDLQKKKLGPTHPHTLVSLNQLAVTHIKLDEPRTALVLAQKAYDQIRKTLGEAHPEFFAALDYLVAACLLLKKHKQAISYAQTAYDFSCAAYGKDSDHAKQLLAQLNTVRARSGK